MSPQTSEKQILECLNPEQREAVLHEEGPLLILAGAGSGKTRTITHRIAHLIHRGQPADGILAITFTNKAAGEMKERTRVLCGLESRWISTFHSFSARVLRRHIHRLAPYDNSFTIYDTDDTRSVLRELMQELDIDREVWTPQSAQTAISRFKNSAAGDVEQLFGADYVYGQVLRKLYHAYSKRLKERNAVDFDDLLLLTVELFREHENVLERYREQFQHVLVDEYQDTNAVQYGITRLLSGKHRNICITGDPDQSIYAWRGADIRNILNFETDYPEARVVKLEQNYRSTKNILHVANALIRHNESHKPKELWTENSEGDPVRVYRFQDERQEAEETVALIDELLRQGTSAGDIAIFYRINSMSRALEEELIYAGIPYTIVGGVEFFQRMEVKDLLAYLAILDNRRDTESLKRIINVPRRGIGKSTLEQLLAKARSDGCCLLDAVLDHEAAPGLNKRALAGVKRFTELYRELSELKDGPVAHLLTAVVQRTDYETYLLHQQKGEEDRIANVGELINAGEEYDKGPDSGGLRGFLEHVRLVSSVDRWDESTDHITLMTLHAAKGLEFPVVVITGAEDGILPLRRRDNPDTDIEEERRLLYVGITRAEERLYITHTAYRLRFGELRESYPSGFLGELQPDLPPGQDSEPLEVDDDTQGSLDALEFSEVYDDYGADDWNLDEDPYPLGARVYHDDYGEGVVSRTTGTGSRRRVTIDFGDAGQKQFVAEYASLRRLR